MPLIRKTPDEAAKAIAAAGPAASLTDASAEMRWTAGRLAADNPGSVPALTEALARESDDRVREAIFTALARIATPQSVLAVLPYVRSNDANLRTGALDALRAMPSLTERHLAQLISDPDSDVRLLACDLARVTTGVHASRLLCELVETDPEANVCAAAVEVLAEIGNADAIQPLARCAARFPNDPFLKFAIEAATSRLARHADRV
jgi:HEAT repeat protein